MTETNSSMAPVEPQKEGKKRDTIYIIIIVILLGIIGFLSFKVSKQSGNITRQDDMLKQDSVRIDDLNAQLDQAMIQIDSLHGRNDSLNALVDAKLEQIKKLQQSLNAQAYNGKVSKETSEKKIKEYENLIAELKAQIADLQKQNNDLKINVNQLNKVKDDLTVQNTQLSSDKQILQTKVGLLKPSGLKIEGMKDVKKPKSTNKVKTTDFLRISFTIPENHEASPGVKTFFARIVDPSGAVATSSSSGQFNNAEGEAMQFSVKVTPQYDQESKAVFFDFKQNIPFKAGKYSVDIYQDGYKVGSSGVELK